MSNINLVEGFYFFSILDEDLKFGLDIDYVFMVIILIISYVYVVESFYNVWFVDRGVSKYIIDRYDWFIILEFILKGRYIIYIVYNIKLWV